MKLIDILNLIAKGELEEGTKIKCRNVIYTYRKLKDYCGNNTLDLYSESNNTLVGGLYLNSIINEEVEIIGHDTNVATKIEELRIDVFNCETLDCENEILRVKDKLNEVIRELNRRGE